jgi:hypothetical protein
VTCLKPAERVLFLPNGAIILAERTPNTQGVLYAEKA